MASCAFRVDGEQVITPRSTSWLPGMTNTVLEGHVEVDPHEDALVLYVDIIDCYFLYIRHIPSPQSSPQEGEEVTLKRGRFLHEIRAAA